MCISIHPSIQQYIYIYIYIYCWRERTTEYIYYFAIVVYMYMYIIYTHTHNTLYYKTTHDRICIHVAYLHHIYIYMRVELQGFDAMRKSN